MTFQLPNLRPILRPVAALALLAVIALAPTPVSLSGVALAQTPAPTNSASPTPPPTAVASSSNDATLHKVHIGGDGFSIINPGPGEEASGNIAFDKDNEATVELDSYLTSSSICAWPTQPQASVAIDREDSLPGITFDQSLHSSKGCASPVDFDVQTGSNDVTITVTAPDGVTIIRYLITIVVPERLAAPAPETWAQDPVTRGHTFITPYTNEALATGFTSANGSADRFWIASIRVEEELARLARVVVSLYDRETGEVDRGAGFNIGPCNEVPSTFKVCEYGSFANPEIWYGNGILWLTVEKHDSGHGNRHYLYAFQRSGSSWKLLSDKTIRLTHYDHISAGRDNSPGGIWSDRETMWVTGHHLRAYAYNMATGERDRSKEFSVPGTTGKPPFLPYSVGSPAGLWSNGKTMWVEGAKRRVVYAFDLQTKARVPSRDFDIVRAPPPPSPYDLLKMITSGMWSDGSIIWVRQGLFNVAYDLPGTPPRFAAFYAVEMASDSSDVPNLITVVAADADNDSITYAKAGDWPAQFGIDSTSGVISYTRGIGASVAPGEYELPVTADDGIDGTAETTVVVSVPGICDRTPQVRDGILALLPNVSDCELVTGAHLAGITGDLLLSDAGITVLQEGDFRGLTSLRLLYLYDNNLSELPAGLFEGLSKLDRLRLEGNPGAPFTLTAELERRGDGAVAVKVAEGSPFDMEVGLSAEGGTLSSTAIEVEGGKTASGAITVTPAGNGHAQVVISVESAEFDEDDYDFYSGIRIGFGEPLILGDAEGGNSPATGLPTISGTAQVGETLTASTSGIADADGLSGATFSYQWLYSRDTQIQGATGTAYTLVPADAGKTVKVRVTFTDDTGNGESLTSASTATVASANLQGICDRSEVVRRSILHYLPGIRECSEVTEAHLSSIRGSVFSDDSAIFFLRWTTRTLKPGDFRGLSSVVHLDLTVRELEELPAGVFDGLSSLEELRLGSNSLSELPEGLFDGLSTLKVLRVSNNDLTELPEDVFDGLTNLEVLTLWGNDLTALPEDVFDGLSNLEDLWLKHNDISGLSANVFDDLSGLKRLFFSENNLGESGLPDDVFDGLSNLEELYLRHNNLTRLPNDVFEGLSSLEGLALDHNDLSELPDGIFDGLSNLEGLGLVGNNLSELPDGVFEGLSNLERLRMTTNPGAPFTITAELEPQGDAAFVVKVDEGAPFEMSITLSAQGGTLSDTTITIDGGSLVSQPITVTRSGEEQTQVTIRVESAVFQGYEFYLGHIPYNGIQAGLGAPLVLGSAPVNTPATGSPTISGTAQEGETLTADSSGISDGNGLSSATFSYQWIRNDGTTDTDIAGATGSTYTLVSADVGKTIKVRVSFTDDAGNPESLTSAGTAVVTAKPNTPATGAPTISGTAQVGRTLTADASGIADADGLSGATYSYQWVSSRDTEIQGATGATYTLQASDAGKIIKVRVSFTDDADNEETLTSEPTEAVAATSSVTIELSPSGSVEEGTEITVTMSFANLGSDSDTSTTDYIFRADVVGADECEDQAGGYGLGVDRYMHKVDQDPETRTGTISAGCPAGDYTLRASVSSPGNVELASASASFSVREPETPLSKDAALSGLTLSGVDIGAFDPATSGYTADVDHDVTETTVTATVNDGGASYLVKLDGAADSDGVIPLAVGSNVIAVEVTAEDGETAKTYIVTVTRAAPPLSKDTTLSGLALSDAPFTFASDTTSYDVNVAHDVDETTVAPTTNDDEATYVVKLDEVADADGVIPLAVGGNVIAVEVTAEDGNTVKTYKVTVTRAALTVSGPAATVELSSDSVDEGTEITVTMSFSGLDTDSDTATKDYVFRADVVDAENGDADACEDRANGYGLGVERYMWQVDEDPEVRTGTISAGCPAGAYTLRASVSSASNVELASASATFSVREGETPLSKDATLSGLTLSGVDLGAFDAATTGYTAEVDNEVTETTVTATVNDDGASYLVKLDGAADADGIVGLAVGSNVITVEVTAEDGETTKTYTVTVTRAAPPPSNDATLSSLTLSGAPFAFDPAIESYEVSVGHEVKQTTITAETNDEAASYEVALVLGGSYEDGTVGLAVGANDIVLVVKAADGETMKTYAVTVTRAEA